MLTRLCDIEGCENQADFVVGVWEEGVGDELFLQTDVCGAEHAKDAIANFLEELAGIEKDA